jgi:hypothetical protein
MIGLYVFIMVVGVLLVFFGHRLHKSLLSSMGACIFFIISWNVLAATTPYSLYACLGIAFVISFLGGTTFAYHSLTISDCV